jgi:hypothetical protein
MAEKEKNFATNLYGEKGLNPKIGNKREIFKFSNPRELQSGQQ